MPQTPSLTSIFSSMLSSALPKPSATFNTANSTPTTAIKAPAPVVAPAAKPAVPAFNVYGTNNVAPVAPPVSFTTANSTPTKIATPAVPSIAPTNNVQGSGTALAPGQFGGSTTTPTVPQISPASSSYVTTPSGATVDPNTGALISGASSGQQSETVSGAGGSVGYDNTGNASSAANYSGSAGGAPALPGAYGNSLITNDADEAAYKKYLESLTPSDEETGAMKNLNDLNTAASTAYVNTQNQPIALPFITGQQAALQRSQVNLAQPLTAQIALLQAKRTMATTASKAALDREDAKLAAARDLATKTVDVPFGGSVSQFDPATGTYKPINGGAAGSDQATTDSWVSLIKGGQASLSDVPQQLRQNVAQGLSTSPSVSKANQDAIAQADTVIQKVTDILPTINATNTGFASYASAIKGTPQYNLAAQLNTIKSNVGFAALQAMRAASPTGGALGQVSEQENTLLQSTLASLDQGQSPEQLKSNLSKVQLHFENLKKVLNAPINSQVTYDDAGNVIVTPPKGAFSSTSNSSALSSTSGSIYDF